MTFIKTKIGGAVIIALIIIAGAAIVKTRVSSVPQNLQKQVGLIADAAVQNAIENNSGSNIDSITSTSTVNDKIAILGNGTSSTTEALTATDRFAQNFFTQYMNLKESGAAIDETTGTNLVDNALSQDYGSPVEEKTYTESDIKVTDDSSIQALKQYGNALGAIIQEPLPKGYESELLILAKANDDGNNAELGNLSSNIAHYQYIRGQMLAISVPYTMATAHLALINSISLILEGVQGMSLIETDPVGATKLVAHYQDGTNSLPISLEMIKENLSKQSVTFSSNESGYILTQ